jgi:hypothetical protein
MRGTWQGSGTWKTTGGGGGGLVLVVIVAALAIGSGAVSAAVSALVTVLIAAACITAAAVLTGIGVLIYRARQDRPGRPIAAPGVYQLPPEPRPELPPSRRAAIGPGRELHIHLHGLTPDQIAAIVTQRGAYLEDR